MDPETPPARLRALLLLLCAALAVVLAANAALSIALPDIAAATGAGQAELTWVIDAYALVFAALLLPAGIAADRIGRRTVLVVGLAVFAAAGVVSAFATEPAVLIALRAVAGLGAAAVFPVTLSALVDAYPADRRAFAVGVWSGVSAAGAVLGTVIAGALLEVLWWGSVQLAFGIVALALVPGLVRVVAQHRDPTLSLDPFGALLSAVALTGLVFAVIQAPTAGWASAEVLTALGLGALALAGFVTHELRTAAPSLDVRLFARRGLAAGALLVSLQFFASLGLFVLAPQYLQIVSGWSPLESALVLLAIPVGVGAGTALAGPLMTRYGPRLPGALGPAVMAAGFAALAVVVGLDATLGQLAPGLVLFGLGFGLAVTPGTVLILDGLPPERRSVASAVNDITREVGGVVGIAVLSSALIATYRADVAPAVADLPLGLQAPVVDGAGGALGVAEGLGPTGAGLADAARAAFTAGFSIALWLGAAVLLACAVTCAVLAPARVRPPPDTPRHGRPESDRTAEPGSSDASHPTPTRPSPAAHHRRETP